LLPPDGNLAPLVSLARGQAGFTEAAGNLALSAGCRRMPNMPEIVEVDNTQLEEVLHRVEQALDEKDAALIRAVFASYVYVTDLVEDKNTSIRRLRQLIFGARTEKTDTVVGRRGEKPEASPQCGVAAKTEWAVGEPERGAS